LSPSTTETDFTVPAVWNVSFVVSVEAAVPVVVNEFTRDPVVATAVDGGTIADVVEPSLKK
jgi:hypothetical protein